MKNLTRQADRDPEEQLLLTELADAGFEVNSVWDLVNSPNCYDEAVPVLVRHLSLDYSDRLKEGIARSLTIPAAKKVAAPFLIKEFEKINDRTALGAKWSIATALSVVATKDFIPALMELAGNSDHGESRIMIVRTLGRFRNRSPEIDNLLKRLVNDLDVGEEASKILSRKGKKIK